MAEDTAQTRHTRHDASICPISISDITDYAANIVVFRVALGTNIEIRQQISQLVLAAQRNGRDGGIGRTAIAMVCYLGG